MSGTTLNPINIWELLIAQGRVLMALMLRDIRTRMFGSAIGFFFVIAWPISHILILVVLYSFMNRVAPYGDSMPLWVTVGATPFMVFSYMSRFMMLSVIHNRPLLYFPVISITDVLFARAIVEILSAALVIFFTNLILALYGIDVMPANIVEALFAIASAGLIGLGVGVLNGVIVAFAPVWITGYSLIVIFLWFSSGILFVPSALPEQLQMILFYHPVLHTIEWLRVAYYDGYESVILARWYPLCFGAGLLFLGLAAERFFRGKILA